MLPNLSNSHFYPFDSFRPLPRDWDARRSRKVAFLHIDCGLHSETQKLLTTLGNSIGPGTVIVFDEFFNYPEWDEQEFRAWKEFTSERALSYRYIGFVPDSHEVAIQLLDKHP
jgi:hypothetical protein